MDALNGTPMNGKMRVANAFGPARAHVVGKGQPSDTRQRSTSPGSDVSIFNEGQFGRFFEVTPGGEVVWENANPYFGPATVDAARQMNNVFRISRYTENEVARARKTSGVF